MLVPGMTMRRRPNMIELEESDMTQDERWIARYNEVMEFMVKNHRNPSRHRIEEHLMLNFVKHNRKLMNKREMKEERIERFKTLLAMMEEYKRKNQYA